MRARLDESPERDIDIVTGNQVVDSGLTKPVINIATGVAQEILHVDNRAAAGGDGSVENPFNNIADALAVGGVQGIVYVNRGDGTTTGHASGVTLDKTGQQLIGSGTDFVWDSSRFTIGQSVQDRPDDLVIRSSGAAPVITNGAGDGITVTADNVTVAGISVDGATQHNISSLDVKNLLIKNNTFANSVGDGIHIVSSGAGDYSVSIGSNTINDSGDRGILISNSGAGFLSSTVNKNLLSRSTSHNLEIRDGGWATNQGSRSITTITNNSINNSNTFGSYITAYGDGHLIALIQNNVSSGNNFSAYNATSLNASIVDVTFDGNTITNGTLGIHARARDIGTTNLTATNNTIVDNAGIGFLLQAVHGATTSANLSGNISTNNGSGVVIDDSSSQSLTIDLGGGVLGSTGGNSIYNNTSDLSIDLDGGELKAENNWWGSALGLQPANVTFNAGSTVDATPFLTIAP